MTDNMGRVFLRETSLRKMQAKKSPQAEGLPQPPLFPEPDTAKTRIPLVSPEDLRIPSMDLKTALERRRSIRSFSEEYLSLEELSWLLWATQGIQEIRGTEGVRRTWRNVPSAGGRHPFDTWLTLSRVSGLMPGIYTYLPGEHALQEENSERDFSRDVARICRNQLFMASAAVNFFWVADEYRFMWRHMERGYRFVMQDAGHVCQNLYLACENAGCGCCAIGYFDEPELCSLFGIDGLEHFPAYAASVGKSGKK